MKIEKAIEILFDLAKFSANYGSNEMDHALEMAITSLEADLAREQSRDQTIKNLPKD